MSVSAPQPPISQPQVVLPIASQSARNLTGQQVALLGRPYSPCPSRQCRCTCLRPCMRLGYASEHAIQQLTTSACCQGMPHVSAVGHTLSAQTRAQVGIKREASETADLRASSSPASHLGGASAQSETSRAAAASPSGCRAESVPAVRRVEAHPAALADIKPQVRNSALIRCTAFIAAFQCSTLCVWAPDVSPICLLPARGISSKCTQCRVGVSVEVLGCLLCKHVRVMPSSSGAMAQQSR